MSISDVRYYHALMPNAPQLTGADPEAVRNIVKACLVEGFGSTTAISGVIQDGICTITVNSGHSFGDHSTVQISGILNRPNMNGLVRVVSMGDNFFTFKTSEPNGALTTGTFIGCSYAPIGWELPMPESSNSTVVRSSDPTSDKYYLRITETDYETVQVQFFDEMYSAEEGINPVPGVFVTNTDYNGKGLYWGKAVADNTVPRYWCIIGDRKRFYFLSKPYGNIDDFARGVAAGFFGDIDYVLHEHTNLRAKTCIFGADRAVVASKNYSKALGYNAVERAQMNYISKGLYDTYALPVSQTVMTGPDMYSGGSGLAMPVWQHGKIIKKRISLSDQMYNNYGYVPGAYFMNNTTELSFNNLIVYSDVSDDDRPYLVAYTSRGTSSISGTPYAVNSSCVLFDILGPWE